MSSEIKTEYENRIRKTQYEAMRRGFSGLIIFGLAPRRIGDLMYLTGHQPLLPGHPRRFNFKGRGYSAIVLPCDEEASLLTTTPFYEDDLYINDVKYGDDLPYEIAVATKKHKIESKDIGIVGMDILAVSLYEDLKKELPFARFTAADDIVMNLRSKKSSFELKLIRTGASIADEVSDNLREFLRKGISEKQVYTFITEQLSKRGVSNAFATCQSGWRSETAYNLNPASDKIIVNGDMIHMEINGKYEGYMIDVCRSTVIGKASPNQVLILDTVLEMFNESIQGIKPRITAESLEKISGEIALKRGFISNHTRTYNGPATYLGHAIGLGVDEPPVLARGDKTPLETGMVLTIEPGLYATGHGGCRIEDEILVTETGYENLNNSEKKWW